MIADAVVVGLGAMGSAALYQLAKRGAAVVGIDRHAPPHTFGSTHGESRITRQGIGEGADYVPLVLRSHEIWRELEAETGEDLLHEVGCLILGDEAAEAHGAPFFAQTIASATRFGIAHKVLVGGDAIRERFPQFVVGENDSGYYEPGGGYVRPERAVAAQLRRARELGAEIRTAEVLRIEESAGRVVVTTSAGEIEARQAVVAAGAWAGALLGPPFSTTLRPTRQVMHWFALEPESVATWQAGPTFIWLHGNAADHFYGFPAIDGAAAIKVADENGSAVDPDHVDRSVSEAQSQEMHARHLAGRLVGVTPTPVRATTCLYTEAPGSRFIIGSHPAHEKILVVSACSGHGFKHSAAIGEAVAKRILAEPEQLLAPFASLSRG